MLACKVQHPRAEGAAQQRVGRCVGDADNRGEDTRPAPELERPEANRDCDFGTVARASKLRASAAHRSCLLGLIEQAPHGGMVRAEALAHQYFDRLTNQFITKMAKQLFGFGVGEAESDKNCFGTPPPSGRCVLRAF